MSYMPCRLIRLHEKNPVFRTHSWITVVYYGGMFDIALATCRELPALADDDAVLLKALQRRNLSVCMHFWDDPEVDWAEAKLTLIRTTWDYHHRLDAYMQWAERVATQSELWNPAAVIRWNTHKGYLRQLAELGIPIIDTTWVAHGASVELAEVCDAHSWKEVVIKPAVGASSHESIRMPLCDLSRGQEHLDRLVPAHDMMIQPFVNSVVTDGEVSLLWIDGQFTHAVRKRAKQGDYRVQDDFGGTIEAVTLDPIWVNIGQQCIDAISEEILYARVDLVCNNQGEYVVIELELVEPALYFLQGPESAELLVNALVTRIDR